MLPSVYLNSHRPNSNRYECICILYVVSLYWFVAVVFLFRFVYTQRHDLHFILSVVISSSPSIRCMFFETCSNTTQFDLRIFTNRRTMLRNMNLLKKRINRKYFDKFHKIGNRVTKKATKPVLVWINFIDIWKLLLSLNRACFEIDSGPVCGMTRKRETNGVLLWHWFSIIFSPARNTRNPYKFEYDEHIKGEPIWQYRPTRIFLCYWKWTRSILVENYDSLLMINRIKTILGKVYKRQGNNEAVTTQNEPYIFCFVGNIHHLDIRTHDRQQNSKRGLKIRMKSSKKRNKKKIPKNK